MSELAKFAILRAKTDRELVTVISHQLERGLRLARTDSAPRTEAERAYAEAVLLLPRVYALPEAERRWLENRISELRAALDERYREPSRTRAAAS